MDDDWRLRVNLEHAEHAKALTGQLQADELGDDVARELGDAVVVSHDGPQVFLYTATQAAALAAERVVRVDLARHGLEPEIALSRWHPDAEDWEPADSASATTAAQREAEHARLMQREDADSAAHGVPDFEARAVLPTHHAAHELSERLTREGVPHTRRWRYVLIGAADEDAAHEWAQRLRDESPPGTEVTEEGTFAYVEQANPTPFKGVAALGGGVP